MLTLPFVQRCPSGKRRYLFTRDALNAARRVAEKLRKKQRPYLCPMCGNWHLTTIHEKRDNN